MWAFFIRDEMTYSHIGWIPCINGHLDFGLMIPGIVGSFTTNSLTDPKTSSINFGFIHRDGHHARRVIIQSKVDWKDNKNDDLNGDFRVILIAEANESDNLDQRKLTGSLYIYPLSSEPALNKGKSKLPWFEQIHSANDTLNQYKDNKQEDWEVVKNKLNTNYTTLKDILSDSDINPIKSHFYEISFDVNNNGLTKLLLSSSHTECEDDFVKYLVTRQAFYYVKYSLHSHKHHFSQEDSLTTIVPFDSTQKEQVGLRLLGQLKRELTSIKRTYSSGGNRAFCDEQGILAYMNSFCMSLKSNGYLSDPVYSREVEYLKSVQVSFSVQTDKQEKRDKRIQEIKSTYRTYLALGISLVSVVWLTTIRNFMSYENKNMFVNPYSLIENILILVVILICALYLYREQVRYKIKNTLDTEGLICWIERHYNIQDAEFKKIIMGKRIKAVGIIFISAVFALASASVS